MSNPVEFDQYDTFLHEVKERIATARVRAALAVAELRIAIDEGRRAYLESTR
jgi:putative component of toxin-antitoxin plasmid stabilization module